MFADLPSILVRGIDNRAACLPYNCGKVRTWPFFRVRSPYGSYITIDAAIVAKVLKECHSMFSL